MLNLPDLLSCAVHPRWVSNVLFRHRVTYGNYLENVFTLSPKIADPAPGPRPAPELARYDRLTTERGRRIREYGIVTS